MPFGDLLMSPGLFSGELQLVILNLKIHFGSLTKSEIHAALDFLSTKVSLLSPVSG